MNWWHIWRNKYEQERLDTIRKDKQYLIGEIKKAHMDWVCAQAQFEFALGVDQVDYAVYTLEATEKRYEMLIKQAKQMQISLIDNDRLMEV
jgi:hypothetical protein